ncbi:MAG: nitroreductase family protein [Nanoarchaeota archaeon]
MDRKTEYEIEEAFVNRWSPRSFTGESIQEETLNRIFEAARWAPSSFNSQPWRYLYSIKGDDNWNMYLDFLVEFNRMWASNAGALIVILSRKTFEKEGEFSPTHQFDTGASWQNMALQATSMGFHMHGIGGFDAKKARERLGVPEEFDIIAMAAIGVKDQPERLPDKLRGSETPSDRLTVADISRKGLFDKDIWS